MAQEDVFKKLVSHCKEYGFVFPSSATKIGIYIISRAGGVLIYLIVTNSHFAFLSQSVRQTD